MNDRSSHAERRAKRQDPQEIERLAEMFGNRLTKRWSHLAAFALRERTNAFRAYDCDIPEIPLVVDHYAGHLVVADRRRFLDEGEADGGWFAAMQKVCADVLGVSRAAIFAKIRRRRQSPDKQYQRLPVADAWVEVDEEPARLWVNLAGYLDTGLFIDHRPTRRLVASVSAERHVLNLYSYTAAFSVHAGLAGAASTTSVDLSNTYCEWAERNLRHNGLQPSSHRVLRADVRDFLRSARREKQRWDIVVADPPTFSNSAKMHYTWDVQRDHESLLDDLSAVVAPDGELYFSTNRRGFSLAPGVTQRLGVEDITDATLAEDIRDRHIHRAYRMRTR